MLRLNYIKAAPRPYEYLCTLSHYFHDCGLPDGLVELGEKVTRVEPGETVRFLSYSDLN